jgi:hypothetical protein
VIAISNSFYQNYTAVAAVTVTSHVTVDPLTVVAVIFVLPSALPTIFPCFGVTVAIVGSLEVKVTVLSSAFSGKTVAVNVSFAPTTSDNVVLFNVTLVGAITLLFWL